MMRRQHIEDDTLELFLLRRLPQAEAAQISWHLLACETCRQAAGRAKQFVEAVRQCSMIIAGQEVQTIH